MRLQCGDCMELMREIPDGAVDMVLADLPYGTTACKWDTPLPIDALWAEYRRVIRKNGVICLFGVEPFSTRLRMGALDLFKYDWVWEKNRPTGFQHAKNMPLRNYEIVSVFSGGSIAHKTQCREDRRMPYYPQGVRMIQKERGGGLRKMGSIIGPRPSNRKRYTQQYEGFPHMILRFRKDGDREKVHNCQKPVALLEYLIKTYTREGDLVLDNVMGSGSTGVACVRTGREFIGMELDAGIFATAEHRIADEIERAATRAG